MEPIRWALFLIFLISVNEARVIEQEIAKSDSIRTKRDNKPRFLGQTQSQYLNFGESDDGKAEAEATHGGSRATVYGKNGMGQAQSMSVGSDCSDCYNSHYGYRDTDRPDPIRQVPGDKQVIVDGTGKVISRPGVSYQIGDTRTPGGIGSFTGDSQPQNGWSQSGDSSRTPGKQGTIVTPTGSWYDTQRPGQVIVDNNGRILSKPDATYQTFGTNGQPTGSTSGFTQSQGPISGYPGQQHISSQDTHRTNGLPIGPGYQQGQSGLKPGQDSSSGTRVIPTGSLSTDGSSKIPGFPQTSFPGTHSQNGHLVPDRQTDTGTQHYNVNNGIQPGANGQSTGFMPGISQPSVNGKIQPGTVSQIPGISQNVNGQVQGSKPGTSSQPGTGGQSGTNGQPGVFNQISGIPQQILDSRNQFGNANQPGIYPQISGTSPQTVNGGQGQSSGVSQTKPHLHGSTLPGQNNVYSPIGELIPGNYTSRRGAQPGHAGGVFTTGPDGKPQFVPFPPGDHTVYNPNGGLTVLVGTGGPKQTVIGTGKRFDGPFRILPGSPSGQKIPGVAQQTVYTPGGGLTVLVGTGGPHQTVYHHPHDYDQSKVSQHIVPSDSSSAEIDNFTKDEHEQRGDIPGHLIMPGQIPAPKKDESDQSGRIDSGKPTMFAGPDGKLYPIGTQPQQTGTPITGQQPGTYISGQQPGTYVGPDGKVYSIGTQSQQPGTQISGQQPGTYVGPDGKVYSTGTQPIQPGSQISGQQPGTYVGPDGKVYSIGTQPQQPGTQITGQQPGTYVSGQQPGTYVGPDGRIYSTGTLPQQPGTQITGQQPGTYIGGQQPGTYIGPDGRVYSTGTQPQQPGTPITGQQPGTLITGQQQPGTYVSGQQPGTYVGSDGKVYSIGTQPQQPGSHISGQQPGTYVSGQQPGQYVSGQQPGTYVGPDGRVYSTNSQPQQPETQVTAQPGTYIGGQPGTYVGPDGRVYSTGTQPQQPGTPITGQQPGTYVSGQQPGTYIGSDGRVYSTGTQPQQPGTQITGQQPGTYINGQQPGTYVGPDGKIYSIGAQPQQPGTQISGQQPGTYTSGQQPGTYTSGQQPGTYVGPDGKVYSVGTQPLQPGSQISGQQPGTYVGPDGKVYSIGTQPQQPGSQITGQQPGTYIGPDGKVYSIGTQPQIPGSQISGQQPGTYTSGQQPGTYVGHDGKVYSIGTQPQQSGSQISGQQPGTYVGPDGKVYTIRSQPQQPGTQISGQQPHTVGSQKLPGVQVPFIGPDGKVIYQQPKIESLGGIPGQTVITSEKCLGGLPCSGDGVSQPDETAPENLEKSEDDEDDFAQAESTIKGGEVMASAQGKKNGGTAETQVSGTYSGTGSFSATAQTSDKDRSAQAQISGGKDGAKTSSQGSGGKARSQAEIAVNSKTGGTSATSQSGGKNYESQSEVIADEKGGLADAQSSGPGQTSSQAQIGFRPQEEDTNAAIYSVFNGGGTASAQSGANTGQSQAQINGKFSKYGIAYHGAAQTGSGTKEQVKKIRDESRALFRNIELFGKSNKKIEIRSDTDDPNLRTRNSKHTAITSFNPTIPSLPQIIATTLSPINVDDEIEYDEDDEYDEGGDEDYYTQPNAKLPNNLEHKSNGKMFVTESSIGDVVTIISEGNTKIFSQSSPTQKQTVVVNTDRPFRLTQTQNGKTFTYPPKPKENIERDSSEIPENLSVFNKHKQADEKPSNINSQNKYSTRYLPSKSDVKDEDKSGNVVKITNSFSDSNDESNNDKSKFASTYFTKSTNCGHVTFSCNIIYGKNGRSKVCRPKQTTGKC